MLINKGSVMHIGHNNIHGNYSMSNQHLSTADEQEDQEVFISRWAETNTEKLLKNNQQNSGTHRPQLHVLKNKEIIHLPNKFLRPHLEYAVQFWTLPLRRDIDKLKKAHRRVTKMIPEIKNHSCNQRQRPKLNSCIQRFECN